MGALAAYGGDFGVILESLFVYDGDFVATLGSLLAFRPALGPIWHHFGFTWGALAACGGDFRGTLGSGLGQLGVSLGSVWVLVDEFGSLDGHFAIIVDSPWVYEGPLSKNTHFPHIF